MLFAAATLAVLAAAPALASPLSGEVDVAAGVSVGPFSASAEVDAEAGLSVGRHGIHAEAGLDVDIDLSGLSLCRNRKNAGLHVDLKAKLDIECNFFSIDFRARMNTPAHLKYEAALEIYHDVMYLVRHALMHRGTRRMKLLIEIAMMVHDGQTLLKAGGFLNAKDTRRVRRSWIQHEINSLNAKFERAMFISRHLPNLCLAQDVFNFVVDASVAVVEVAVGATIAVGAAIGVAIHEAAHFVARAFHYMAHVLHWAIHEIEYAFIMFVKKTKRFLKKVGHGIKVGVKAIGHGLHKIAHGIKEGAEDVVSIIVDIGHHLHHHHHCHAICHDDSSSSSSECPCGDTDKDDGYATVTQVCQAEQQVCAKEAFTAKITAQYDIELSWTKEVAQQKVIECATTVFGAIDGLRGELRAMESEVTPQLEAEPAEEEAE